MQRNYWLVYAGLMSMISFIMTVVLFFSDVGRTKIYNFVLGEVATFTTILRVIVSTIDFLQEKKLRFFHAQVFFWFTLGLLGFSCATWLVDSK